MKRILVVVVLATLVVPAWGQISHSRSTSGGGTWGGGSGNTFFNGGGFWRPGGFWPMQPFGHYRPTYAGLGYDFPLGGCPCYNPYSSCSYYGGYGSYGMPYYGYDGSNYQPALYNSARFVEEWKDRDPIAERGSESQDSTLRQSILLKDGMDEEQVVMAIGTPVQRVQLGERAVWKYSGYSLLFEGGRLKEIR